MSLDLRRIRVGIEVSGQINFYEGLRVKVSGTKFASPVQNECVVVISGLKQETRDYILTETSPFNDNRTPKRLVVDVGRISYGLSRLFVGDIVSAQPSSPPDLDLTIKAKTENAQAGKVISTSAGPSVRLSALTQRVASDLDISPIFQATDKNIANYTHTGGALAQVQKLAAAGMVNAFIDDKSLIVKNKNTALSGKMRILNKDSGMVGIPRGDEKGVKVQFLIDPDAAIGGALRIDSKLNKSLNGDYIIEQLAFEAASHDTPFFYTATATRL